jgi:hypothetical protein
MVEIILKIEERFTNQGDIHTDVAVNVVPKGIPTNSEKLAAEILLTGMTFALQEGADVIGGTFDIRHMDDN